MMTDLVTDEGFIVRKREDDPWRDFENSLAILLGAMYDDYFSNRADEVAQVAVDDPDNLQVLLDSLLDPSVPLVRESDRQEIFGLVLSSALAGASVNGVTSLATTAVAFQMIDASVDQFIDGANRYYDRLGKGRIAQAATSSIASGGGVIEVARAVRSEVSNRNKWQLHANQTVLRNFNYGIAKTADESFSGYRLVAVLDERTSDICLELNGRTFWIADAVAKYESLFTVDSDSVPSSHRWINNVSEVEGRTSEQLSSGGILVPPFHAHCRTTISRVP